jgi:hypothetical protein
MKKFLGILAISATMVACNNSADSTENKQDSIDSAANAQKELVDSSANATTNAIDSAADATKDKIDSSAAAKKDSTKH